MTTTLMTRHANELLSLLTLDQADWHIGLTVRDQLDVETATLPAVDEAAIEKIFGDLLAVHSDDRWDYLAARGYSQVDLDRLSAMMAEWMSPESKSRLLKMAANYDSTSSVDLTKSWLETTGIRHLADITARYRFVPPEPAICHAIVDAMETAQAAIRVARIRRKQTTRQPEEWTNGETEDFEEDLRWAEAGYDEEVASWPEY